MGDPARAFGRAKCRHCGRFCSNVGAMIRGGHDGYIDGVYGDCKKCGDMVPVKEASGMGWSWDMFDGVDRDATLSNVLASGGTFA